MNKITFGFKKERCSMSDKLVVCEETKQYEVGQCCVNSDYVDVFVKLSDLSKLERYYESLGYTKTTERFSH